MENKVRTMIEERLKRTTVKVVESVKPEVNKPVFTSNLPRPVNDVVNTQSIVAPAEFVPSISSIELKPPKVSMGEDEFVVKSASPVKPSSNSPKSILQLHGSRSENDSEHSDFSGKYIQFRRVCKTLRNTPLSSRNMVYFIH